MRLRFNPGCNFLIFFFSFYVHSIGGAPASHRMTVENQAECHRLILEDILYRVSLFLFESISIEKETVVRYTVILYGIYFFSLKILLSLRDQSFRIVLYMHVEVEKYKSICKPN